MSIREIRHFLENGTNDADLKAFMENEIKRAEEGAEDFKPLVIRLKEGGAEAGVIFKGEDGRLVPSLHPVYAEDIADEVNDFIMSFQDNIKVSY